MGPQALPPGSEAATWAGSKGMGHLPNRNTPGDLTISTPRKQGCLEKEKKRGAPRMMETCQENT